MDIIFEQADPLSPEEQKLYVQNIILCYVLLWVAYVQSKLMKKGMKLNAEEDNLLCAFIHGMQRIKLAGAERRAFANLVSHYKEFAKLEYNPPLILKLNSVLQLIIAVLGMFVLSFSVFEGGVTPGNYITFMISYGLLSDAFIVLSSVSMPIVPIGSLMDMIKLVLGAEPEDVRGKMLTRLTLSIEIPNVSFRHSEKTPLILDNISFKLRLGEYVAIVGYVMQNSDLFPGSICSSILISVSHLSEKDAWEIAEMAGVADDIRKKLMKMETLISEVASTIFIGQYQRIIIARAITGHPKILVLDGGRIAEEGTYNQLKSRSSLSASLVKRQQLAEVE